MAEHCYSKRVVSMSVSIIQSLLIGNNLNLTTLFLGCIHSSTDGLLKSITYSCVPLVGYKVYLYFPLSLLIKTPFDQLFCCIISKYNIRCCFGKSKKVCEKINKSMMMYDVEIAILETL